MADDRAIRKPALPRCASVYSSTGAISGQRNGSMSRMTYVEPQPISRTEVERIFASNDTNAIESTLVDIAIHDPDWQWSKTPVLDLRVILCRAFVRLP
jgi:hypothetical protein